MTLSAKLQAAEAGNRGLDSDVWNFFGFEPVFSEPLGEHRVMLYTIPHVTTSIDAAYALAERVLPGWVFSVNSTLGAGPSYVQMAPEQWGYYESAKESCGVTVTAATPALALCAAVLEAKEGGS